MGVSVLTQHNDNQRTGVNPHEPDLTPGAVRARFRRLTELQVDPAIEGGPTGWKPQIVAQPLLASGVAWPGAGANDVLIVATLHGTVYAFDATHNNNPTHAYPRLWAVWLGPPVLTFPGFDGKDIWQTNPEWGILGTPVIDPGRKRVYVVAWNPDGCGIYRLHSLDLTTGNPVTAARSSRVRPRDRTARSRLTRCSRSSGRACSWSARRTYPPPGGPTSARTGPCTSPSAPRPRS